MGHGDEKMGFFGEEPEYQTTGEIVLVNGEIRTITVEGIKVEFHIKNYVNDRFFTEEEIEKFGANTDEKGIYLSRFVLSENK